MNRLLLAITALAICLFAVGCSGCATALSPAPAPSAGDTISPRAGDAALARAFSDHSSGVEVEGEGTVSRLLTDDTAGARHQRFIVRLASGQTILVAHNIDVAQRVDPLLVGDTVSFKGVYEWNGQGGLVHWTHRDPAGSHVAGWIKHGGRTYQ
jgi:hypothetical protein